MQPRRDGSERKEAYAGNASLRDVSRIRWVNKLGVSIVLSYARREAYRRSSRNVKLHRELEYRAAVTETPEHQPRQLLLINRGNVIGNVRCIARNSESYRS